MEEAGGLPLGFSEALFPFTRPRSGLYPRLGKRSVPDTPSWSLGKSPCWRAAPSHACPLALKRLGLRLPFWWAMNLGHVQEGFQEWAS